MPARRTRRRGASPTRESESEAAAIQHGSEEDIAQIFVEKMKASLAAAKADRLAGSSKVESGPSSLGDDVLLLDSTTQKAHE